jgi:hypothetical protein
MPSTGMWRRVVLLRTELSEGQFASIQIASSSLLANFLRSFWLADSFISEDVPRNVGYYKAYMTQYSGRRHSS